MTYPIEDNVLQNLYKNTLPQLPENTVLFRFEWTLPNSVRETIAVYYQNEMKHIYYAEEYRIFDDTECDTYRYICVLNG